ncbi:MAG: cytochrome c biogenesis protein CcdA [Deltaproteobacteria bacterium]|nr:cytochrome c biogenesis protein CcdA [Deltaproteobacteria bacterium]
MLEEFVNNIGTYIQTNPWLAIAAVFVGGLLTASNPCVLAMIPLMMSFVAGRREQATGTLRAFGYSLVFVTGLAITFTALGMFTALAGSMYGDISDVWSWIVALVCLVMGLHLMEVLKFTIPMPFNVQPKIRGTAGAFVLGLLFGVVSAPCAAPILLVLLTYLAGSGASVVYGGFLLLVYALGHSVLILVAGTSMGAARRIIESKKTTRVTDLMRRGAGVLIILVGAFFVYDSLAKHQEVEPAVEEKATQTETQPQKSRVSKIVFIGQKQACECTRNRIDETWKALESALEGGPALPVERLHLDVDEEKTEKYHEMRALMVAPGIYFFNESGKLFEMLQGEVRVDEFAEVLR